MNLYVELEDVSKVYPVGSSVAGELVAAMADGDTKERNPEGTVAVDGVTLTLHEGDRLGIVGRNGAGKSTLLHLIAGLSDPTSGSIRIRGKVTSIMTLGVGLRDDLSGRENIYVDGEIQGKSRSETEAVIEQIIDFSELGDFIEYPVRTYSTGMKARLAFAMISHIDPEILIIDEALSVGDASFSVKATARILEICSRGKIVILVSHGMQSIRDICNRCLYMKDGRVVMDGTPDAVTKAYVDEVREADEAALLQNFRSHVGSRSFKAGCGFERVTLLSGDSEQNCVRIEAGCRLRIRVIARHTGLDRAAVLRMRIVRLDDVLLFHEDFAVSDYALDLDCVGIEVEFSPMALGAAIYRLDVFLLEDKRTADVLIAECSTIFEVFTMDPPSGGKPMLLYPVFASSTHH